MWTLSGFSDEISPDPVEQCQVARGLGLRYRRDPQCLERQHPRSRSRPARHAAADPRSTRAAGLEHRLPDRQDLHRRRLRAPPGADAARRRGGPTVRGSRTSGSSPSSSREGDDPDRHRDEVLRRMRALADVAEQSRRDLAAREREGHLRRHPAPLPGHRHRGRLAQTARWPGTRRTSSRWESGPSPRAMPSCGRTWTTSRSRTPASPTGRSWWPATATARSWRRSAPCATTASTASSPSSPTWPTTTPLGGFSGAELWTSAWKAFTDILKAEGIEYA